jgi:hypothetical protein
VWSPAAGVDEHLDHGTQDREPKGEAEDRPEGVDVVEATSEGGDAELRKIMSKMYADVAHFKETHEKATWREAAFCLGVQRVAHAVKLRGYV